MLKKGDIIEITIDSLAYEGAGVGRYEGLAVFIPDTAPGDRIKAEIFSARKDYAKGILKEIIEPSQHRIKPVCSLAKVCGGCQWQHVSYEEQIRAKRKIVEDNLRKIAHIDILVYEVIKSDSVTEYRCKVQYPVQQTKVSKRTLAGYYKKGTHEVVNIKYCPVQPDIINDITEFIRTKIQESGLTAYNERTKKGLIRHLVYRYSQSNRNISLIIVINSQTVPDEIIKLSRTVKAKFKEISGIFANLNTSHTNVILDRKMELLTGQDYIEENLEGKRFKISGSSFFQINPPTAVKIFNFVRKTIEERINKPSIIDVYAGVGTFSIWLRDIASRITAVEENPHAISDFKDNIELNKSDNGADIEIIEGNADQAVADLAKGRTYDVTILDPPRKGCSEIVLKSVAEMTDKFIIYVSCNPSTLARDIKLLNDYGFKPEFVQPADMFCHTYHIESIALLTKLG